MAKKTNLARKVLQDFFESGHLYDWEEQGNPNELEAWDYLLAYLWVEGYKIVPIDE